MERVHRKGGYKHITTTSRSAIHEYCLLEQNIDSFLIPAMECAAKLVAHGSTTALSSNRIIRSDVNWSRRSTRLNGLRLHSPASYPRHSPHAHGDVCRCSLQENGHGNITLNFADPASSRAETAWQPSYVQQAAFPATVEDHVFRDSKQLLLSIEGTLQPVEKIKKLGLSEEIVRRISQRNNEPEWMLRFRLDAFHQWLTMEPPHGAYAESECPPIDFHSMSSKNSNHQSPSAGEFQELVDLSDGSFATSHKETLLEAGVIFCSISEAIQKHPALVKEYLGKVVAPAENFYAALNSAVFLDGSFCYVPKNVVCPMDISTHFLVDGRKVTSPFERTLIVCEENSFVSSLGCTSPAPHVDGGAAQQLHASVIELYCAAGGEIKHLTVQNWHEAGAALSHDPEHQVLHNFVTQRGLCDGAASKITWTTVEVGSGVTWQHPAVVLKGDGSVGECFSVTLTNAGQRADTGAAMIHIGSHTRSRIVAKTISAGASRSSFRSRVHVEPWSWNARSESQWDAVLMGEHAESTSCSSVVARNTTAQIEEKGSTSRVSKEQVLYFQQRGILAEKAVPAILTGFCNVVLRELPHEFESEVTEMVAMKIEEFLKGSPSCSPNLAHQ